MQPTTLNPLTIPQSPNNPSAESRKISSENRALTSPCLYLYLSVRNINLPKLQLSATTTTSLRHFTMSLPRAIDTPRAIVTPRRQSIAKLTRTPLSASPISLTRASVANLFNAAFLRDDSPHSDASRDSSVPDLDQLDPRLLELVARHLKDEPQLALEGADITRDLYKLNDSLRPQPKRSRSWSLDTELRRESAGSLNVPGGFRRQFVLSHKTTPNLLTRNFVEFLSIYGHFAGENLEDDDAIACHYAPFHPYEEETPLIGHVNPAGTATDSKAYFLLLKAFVGTGVLFLPKAFSSGGLVFSAVTLFIFGLLSFWCYLILVYAKMAVKVSSFAEIGLRCYGPWLQQLILFSIVLSQVGFVAAYIVFTGENLRAFVGNVTSYNTADMDIFWFILLQTCVLAPLCLIRDITKLSLLALLANVFIFFGLITILTYTVSEFSANKFQPGEGIYFWFNKSEFSMFIGVAIFAFEGIGLIIPIQESMIYPNNFPKVLFKVIMTISLIFIFIGAIGYITFGLSIQTVILLNLPQNSPLVIMVQLFYAFAILLSTPIQIFPAVRLIELRIFPFKSGRNSSSVKWQKNMMRFTFVLATATIALYGGQNLDKFVSFVGCFACIPLVYMYPPMLHLKTCCDYENARTVTERRKKYWLAMLDYFLVLIGGIALLYTTLDILTQ